MPVGKLVSSSVAETTGLDMAKVLGGRYQLGEVEGKCQSVRSRSGAGSGGVQSSIKMMMRAANWT